MWNLRAGGRQVLPALWPDATTGRGLGSRRAGSAGGAADLARGLKGASEQDRLLSIARFNLDWQTHFAESLDPQTADRIHREACKEIDAAELPSADYCSMCGRQWCSVRINKEIREAIKQGEA